MLLFTELWFADVQHFNECIRDPLRSTICRAPNEVTRSLRATRNEPSQTGCEPKVRIQLVKRAARPAPSSLVVVVLLLFLWMMAWRSGERSAAPKQQGAQTGLIDGAVIAATVLL